MKKLLIIFYFFSNLIYSQVDEKILHDNFITSVSKWNGEENIYLLINFKDLNNNTTKEICIHKSDLRDALVYEHNINIKEAQTKLENYKSRYFEFSNIEAIIKLNKYYYSESEINEFKKNVNIETTIKNLKTNENWFLDLGDLNSKENLYALILTKRGFIINISFECFAPSGLWCISCQKE